MPRYCSASPCDTTHARGCFCPNTISVQEHLRTQVIPSTTSRAPRGPRRLSRSFEPVTLQAPGNVQEEILRTRGRDKRRCQASRRLLRSWLETGLWKSDRVGCIGNPSQGSVPISRLLGGLTEVLQCMLRRPDGKRICLTKYSLRECV